MHDLPEQGSPTPVRVHSAVRERNTIPPTYDAVLSDLREADYTIWRDERTPAGAIAVVGGQISTFDFS